MGRNRKILIIGNGPSTTALSNFGFHNLRSNIDTFAMGAAYRYFRQVNWWPTYFAWCDAKTVLSHRYELSQLVDDPNIPTKRFYFSFAISENPKIELIDHCSTGDFCFRKSIELNYREIFLIGIEGDYVEEIPESRPLLRSEYERYGIDQLNLPEKLKKTLRIIHTTPKNNPNYFFPDYQQSGDIYSLPQSKIHRRLWSNVAQLAETSEVNVINLSPSSKIQVFPKSTIDTFSGVLFKNLDKDHCASKRSSIAERAQENCIISSPLWYGPFDRDQNYHIEEDKVVFDLFETGYIKPDKKPIMIDVGACRGAALRVFAEQDWTIHAFEPSTALSNYLREKYKSPKIHIINDAVSDVEKDHVPFYTSKESVGIGSLKAFLPSHELSEQVRTTKLNSYFKAKHINKIDFLKIDTEGYDLMVLKGLDLNRYPVEVILCEFEDLKSKPIGYDFHNLALYLESFNYTIYMSEWHPIVKYGITHQWRILKRYPCELEDTKAWGNLIAFSNDPGIFSITRAIKKSISKFEKKIGIDPTNIPLNGESSTSERLDYALQLLSASRKRNQFLENQLSSVYASTSWKITAPFRSVVETIRHITQYLNKKGRKLF